MHLGVRQSKHIPRTKEVMQPVRQKPGVGTFLLQLQVLLRALSTCPLTCVDGLAPVRVLAPMWDQTPFDQVE
jgi:hypothetical protein